MKIYSPKQWKRRIFSRLIFSELVSVQPMNQATGQLFYLDFKYENTNTQTTSTPKTKRSNLTKD